MECQEISELLSQYVDDALDPRSTKVVEEHIAICDHCAAELADIRSYLKTMGSLQRMEAPPGFLQGVHSRMDRGSWFGDPYSRIGSLLSHGLALRWAGAFAALLVLLITYHGLNMDKSMERHNGSGYAPQVAQLPGPAESPRATSEHPAKVPPATSVQSSPPAPAEHPSSKTPLAETDALPSELGAPRTESTPPSSESKPLSAESKALPVEVRPPSGISRPVPPSLKPIELVLVLKPLPAGIERGTRKNAGDGRGINGPAALEAEGRVTHRRLSPNLGSGRPAAPALPGRERGTAQKDKVEAPAVASTGRTPMLEAMKDNSTDSGVEPADSWGGPSAAGGETAANPHEALARIRSSISNTGGEVLDVQYNARDGLPRAITASIAAGNIVELIHNLERMGSLARPAQPHPSTPQAQKVEVRISLVFSP